MYTKTWKITTCNNTPATKVNLTHVEVIPSNMTFVSATATVGSYNEVTGLWTIGSLNASQCAELTITASCDTNDCIQDNIYGHCHGSHGGKLVVNAGDSDAATNSAFGAAYINPFTTDFLHFWSSDDSLSFTVSQGSAVVDVTVDDEVLSSLIISADADNALTVGTDNLLYVSRDPQEVIDSLTPSATNTIPDLSQTPFDDTKVKFFVNGVLEYLGLITASGTTVTVDPGYNAAYGADIEVTDTVTAIYFQ